MNTDKGRLRKVIGMGPSSDGITLPQSWRESNHIERGDQVYVEVSELGDLLIVRPRSAVSEEAEPAAN